MSIQMVLTGGFFFLGGILLLTMVSIPLGLILMLLGGIPLLVCYYQSFMSWLDQHYPAPTNKKK